jgi:hypothetical protein
MTSQKNQALHPTQAAARKVAKSRVLPFEPMDDDGSTTVGTETPHHNAVQVSQVCQLCQKYLARVVGRLGSGQFAFCFRCAFDDVPAALARAVVGTEQPRCEVEVSVIGSLTDFSRRFCDQLRIMPLSLPTAWIDDVEQRILAALSGCRGRDEHDGLEEDR